MAKAKQIILEDEIGKEFRKLAEKYQGNLMAPYTEVHEGIAAFIKKYSDLSEGKSSGSVRCGYLAALADVLLNNLQEWNDRPYFSLDNVLSDFMLKSKEIDMDSKAKVTEKTIKDKIRIIISELQWPKTQNENKFLYKGSVEYVKIGVLQYGFVYSIVAKPT